LRSGHDESLEEPPALHQEKRGREALASRPLEPLDLWTLGPLDPWTPGPLDPWTPTWSPQTPSP
jgi:hypothetical protein